MTNEEAELAASLHLPLKIKHIGRYQDWRHKGGIGDLTRAEIEWLSGRLKRGVWRIANPQDEMVVVDSSIGVRNVPFGHLEVES